MDASVRDGLSRMHELLYRAGIAGGLVLGHVQRQQTDEAWELEEQLRMALDEIEGARLAALELIESARGRAAH